MKKKLLIVFDESVGDDYKDSFEKPATCKVILTTRKRRITGRKRFDDPEIFKMGQYKYPIATRDCVMTGDSHKPYKKAGKIILRQPDKSKGENIEAYKLKITKFLIQQKDKSNIFHNNIALIPVIKPIIIMRWNDFIKRFPTKERIYAYEKS
ncbi:hypothetical protein KJ980_08245 [Patescibacteria group bacterium]|nr:hypothetical protein [Patescibacteria group bacterium]MBU4016897.1 hypothetical protein [Patescibacteria group bacterium]MBU4099607.1 hypothetical protein [Patescibacteria group bacterium]